MDNDKVKTNHGWTPELEDFFKNSNPPLLNQFRGSFRIKEHKGNHFWYYRLSSSKERGRDKYLCSVDPKGKPQNLSSFQYSCNILLKKIQSNFTVSDRDQRMLYPYIELYIRKVESEGLSVKGRKLATTNGMMTGLKDFNKYCEFNGVKLNVVPTNQMKDVFKEYISSLNTRINPKNKSVGLSKGTIKSYSQNARYFLEWLVKDKIVGGLGLFPAQPISVELQNMLIGDICGKSNKTIEKRFRKEYYEQCYKDCYSKIRSIWTYYCKNGGLLERIRDKNGKINQPPHNLGRDIVYFISLLQIRGGFRIGEVLYSYRNIDSYNNYHLKYFPKEMASFWEKTDNGWMLMIRNSKGKDRDVPMNDTVWSKAKPPSWINFNIVSHKNKTYYETSLVDVIDELFPDSYFMFPSPNYMDKPNQRRSITYYMNLFKSELVIGKNWDRYSINSTHNLRSLFISYAIQRQNITPFKICEITGHTISVMEKFYIRENPQSKLDTFLKMGQQELITKNKSEPVTNKDLIIEFNLIDEEENE